MIAYFTKQYQAVPALMQLYKGAGGVFVTTRRSTKRAIDRVYPGTRIAMLHESLGHFSRGDRILQKSTAIVTGSPNRELLSRYRSPKYMVFHGTCADLSRIGVGLLRNFDHICVIGPRMAKVLSDSGLQERVLVSGYLPFLEFPERNPTARAAFLNRASLDPARKTLLYLPMGRPYSSWNVMAERLLREVPPDYNLIMRPHPNQAVTARIHDKIGFLRLASLCRKRGNAMIDLADYPLSTLFSVSDLLISDGASAPEESLYYDIPLLFVESESASRGVFAAMMRRLGHDEAYIERLLSLYECGMSITPDAPDKLKSIETVLVEADRHHPQRKAYFSWVFGDRGIERQTQFIQDMTKYSI
jgi:hypothetical protein